MYNYTGELLNAVTNLKNQASSTYNLNSFTVVGKDRQLEVFNSICMNKLYSEVPFEPHYVVMPMNKNYSVNGKPLFSNKYLEWLLNESLFSRYYHTETVKELLDTKCCIVDCNAPANLMIASLMAFRYCWEFPQIVKYWEKLVNAGIPKGTAFVVAHHLSNAPNGETDFRLTTGNSNHYIFELNSIGTEAVTSFNAGNDPSKLEEPFIDKRKYSGIQYTWGNGDFIEILRSNLTLSEGVLKQGFGEVDYSYLKQPYAQIKKALDKMGML